MATTLNICLVTRDDIDPPDHGAAAKICGLSLALSKLGCQITLIGNNPRFFYRFSGGRAETVEYPTKGGFIPQPPEIALDFAAKKLGVPLEDYYLFRSYADFNLFSRLFWAAKEFRFDLVQAEFPAYAYPAYILAKHKKLPFVFVEHNIEHERISETADITPAAKERIKRFEEVAVRLGDAVVVCSQEDRNKLKNISGALSRLFVIPHGVDYAAFEGGDRYEARKRYGLNEQDFVIAFHGYLAYPPNREACFVIRDEILPRIAHKIPHCKFLLAGREKPEELGENERMMFVGSQRNIPEFLAAADMAVVPLLSGGGTRLKILEYFAAGLAVVSTSKGAEGIPIQDGDEIALADKFGIFSEEIVRLYEDEAERERLGRAARSFAAKYDWNRIALEYLKLYEILITDCQK